MCMLKDTAGDAVRRSGQWSKKRMLANKPLQRQSVRHHRVLT